MILKTVLLGIILIAGLTCTAQKIFEIHYLGNMGVAIVQHDSAIIIDGLHDYYGPYYLPTDPAAIKKMLQKETPHKNIIAIAVTHKHGDHFDSALITEVANKHTNAVIFAGNQSKSLLGSNIQKRFAPIADSINVPIKPNLFIKLKKIPHSGAERHVGIENYRIEIVWNGFRIVHFGDAGFLPEATEGLSLSPDIAIVPGWFLERDGQLLLQKLNPENIVVTHIAPSDKEAKKGDALKGKVIPFRNYGEKFTIKLY